MIKLTNNYPYILQLQDKIALREFIPSPIDEKTLIEIKRKAEKVLKENK